jgi:hypothetical protein
MSDIADKIYAATGLTLGAEAAAKIGQMIQQARRDAREQVARYHDLMAKMAGSSTELQRRSLWVHSESAKDIRSGIDIRVLGEKE